MFLRIRLLWNKLSGSSDEENPTDNLSGDLSDEPIEFEVGDTLDLHTFHPGDVHALLADYLELARDKGFKEVRIIHGKGTGVLKARVHSLLKRHPGVVSIRQADEPGGGWGATIARLAPHSK